jgi:CRISP-associated protein Cas1
MIKRTLYFGTPVYLYTQLEQMYWQAIDAQPNVNNFKEINNTASTTTNEQTEEVDEFMQGLIDIQKQYQQNTITSAKYNPNHKQTIHQAISHTLINKLLNNNVALITCNENHLPVGLMLNLNGNTLQSQRFQCQVNASLPLKKQLWQQTIQYKIQNQANLLLNQGIQAGNMQKWVQQVKSGDSQNLEAKAAVYYWKNIFTTLPYFTRDRDGEPPNHLLNYGYAILRAIVARSLVGSGLLPTLGIFHRNQYNAYCLADDIMEPYRPYVDQEVIKIITQYGNVTSITKPIKTALLNIPALDVSIDNQTSPLMIAVQRTTASLVKCFEGSLRKIVYPSLLHA